jgi:hypothetical protein
MCGENALKEVMGKVLQKVQVGVGEDWEACWKRSVSGGGWLFMYLHLHVKTDHRVLRIGGHHTIFIYRSSIAGSSRLRQIIIWHAVDISTHDGQVMMVSELSLDSIRCVFYAFFPLFLHFEFMFQNYFVTLKPKPMNPSKLQIRKTVWKN